jgi:hypothetical protein
LFEAFLLKLEKLGLILNLVSLTGCFITPQYGDSSALYDDDYKHVAGTDRDRGSTVATGSNILVDVIGEREGQILRSYLVDSFRDLGNFSSKKYVLHIELSKSEKPFAFSDNEEARRVFFTYKADAKLIDVTANGEAIAIDFDNPLDDGNLKIAKKITTHKAPSLPTKNIQVVTSTTYNIFHPNGRVLLSLYGRHNNALLRELAYRIVEHIKVILSHEK